MKKIGLLLLPALLITTACKTTSTSVTSSGGDVSSTSDSSSEEPEGYATIEAVLHSFEHSSFMLEIEEKEWRTYDEQTVKTVKRAIRSNGSGKVEYLKFAGEDGTELEPLLYVTYTEDDHTVYSEVNGYWIEDDNSDYDGEMNDYVNNVYEMLMDCDEHKYVDWTYNEELGQYTGTMDRVDFKGNYFIQLSYNFIKQIKYQTIDVEDQRVIDITINASGVGSTNVELPDMPIITISDAFNDFSESLSSYESYTMKFYNKMVMDGDTTAYQNFMYEFQELEVSDIHVEVILATNLDDETDSTFYAKLNNGSEIEYYFYDEDNEKWADLDYSDFKDATEPIYKSRDDFSRVNQQDLALAMNEIQSADESEFNFTLNDVIEDAQNFHMNIHVSYSEADLKVFNIDFSGNVLVRDTLAAVDYEQRVSILKVNDTEFNFPSF